MGAYQLKATRRASVTTGDLTLAELDKAEIGQVEWVLNGAGGFGFNIPTLDSKAKYTQPLKYEIQVWRNDQLLHWGFPIKRRIGPDKIECQCLGLWGYFLYRYLHHALDYVGIDQTTIGWNLINYAQTSDFGQAGLTGQTLNITSASFVPSGIQRERHWAADEHHQISKLVDSFTDIIDGYDHSIEIFGDGRREWTPHYPSKGVVRADLVVEFGRNISDFGLDEDGSNLCNFATFTGEGQGPDKLAQSSFDQTAITDNVLMMDVQSDSTVKETGTLLGKAQEHVAKRKTVVQTDQANLVELPVSMIGVVQTGDRLPFRIDHGEAQRTVNRRIIRLTLDPTRDVLAAYFNAA